VVNIVHCVAVTPMPCNVIKLCIHLNGNKKKLKQLYTEQNVVSVLTLSVLIVISSLENKEEEEEEA
jgi:hypothetical protein